MLNSLENPSFLSASVTVINRRIELVNNAKSTIRTGFPQVLAVIVQNLLIISTSEATSFVMVNVNTNQTDCKQICNNTLPPWMGYTHSAVVTLSGGISGFVTNLLGTKRTLEMALVLVILLRLFSSLFIKHWNISVAIIMGNLFAEFFKGPIITQITESAEPYLRGMLLATTASSMLIGQLHELLTKTFLTERLSMYINCSLSLVCLLLMLLVPESPHSLILYEKYDEARKSLAWYRGWVTLEEIEPEFQMMLSCHKVREKTPDVQSESLTSKFSKIVNVSNIFPTKYIKEGYETIKKIPLFFSKTFLSPLMLISFTFFLINFSGATVLLTHYELILSTFNSPFDANYTNIALKGANLLGSTISIFLLKSCGKRILMIISLTCVGIFSFLLSAYAHVTKIETVSNTTRSLVQNGDINAYNWIPVLILFFLSIISHFGLCNLPWVLMGELFPKEFRAIGSGIVCGINKTLQSFCDAFLKHVLDILDLSGLYFFYTGVCFLGILILHLILPETEGKTLEEIETDVANISKNNNP